MLLLRVTFRPNFTIGLALSPFLLYRVKIACQNVLALTRMLCFPSVGMPHTTKYPVFLEFGILGLNLLFGPFKLRSHQN